jgi:hypothetical protein
MMFSPLGFAPATTPQAKGAATCRRRRSINAAVAVSVLLLASAGDGPAAAEEVLHLRCTNPASGTSWPLVVDLGHGRVDSLAATIGNEWISWHDPKQGFFELERATGKLQLRNASATGGYFLYYTCRPE